MRIHKIILFSILLTLFYSCKNDKRKSIQLHSDEYIDSLFQAIEVKDNVEFKLIEDSVSILESKISEILKEKLNHKRSYEIHMITAKIDSLMKNLLIKKADKASFTNAKFPVADINQCINDTIPRHDFQNHISYPICSRKSEKLLWINFKSPEYTWKQMVGREGPLSICENCCISIEFITYKMN